MASEPRDQVVAVPLKEFAKWGGGIDFIRLMLEGLEQDPRLRVVALVPRPTRVKRARNALGAVLRRLKRLAGGRVKARHAQSLSPEQVYAAIADFEPRIAIRYYPDNSRGLRATLRAMGAGVVIPCIRPLSAKCPVPWVGYIFDFQHRHLPQFFTEEERRGRDAAFARMLTSAPVVICNSEAVRLDAERFHPGLASRLVALPFAPVPRLEWFDLDPREARRRHGLPERYFIVCNQFWVHKDHPTAIRAFADFLARGGEPEAALVCTGNVQDYRDPGYAGTLRALIGDLRLTGKVHLLGHIPKADQIALLRGAIAVLQPTWFEGGRGGGAVNDAVALGVPALLSDIPVNLEIVEEGCRFFTTGDPGSLAAAMLDLAAAEPVRAEPAELMRRGAARAANLARTLAGVIALARGEESGGSVITSELHDAGDPDGNG